MMSPFSGPRLLTTAQVQRILAWHERGESWRRQRKRVLSLGMFARRIHMSQGTLERLLPELDQEIERMLRIREWHRAHRELYAARGQMDTVRGLAREFGVTAATVLSAVRRKGQYKMPPPELITLARIQRRAPLKRRKRSKV